MFREQGDTKKGPVDPETLYTKQNCIGGGSFGKVYKGVDKRTGETVAIKIVEIEAADDDVKDIIEEISILAGLSSPYVTKYYGSYLKGSDLWIVMEYCSGGSCNDLMKPGLISEDYIMIILKELLMGLDYLHSDKKLHRDVKCEFPACCLAEPPKTDKSLCSRKHPAGSQWSGKASGLWSLGSIDGHNDEEKHIRRNTVLDGAGGD